MELEVLINKGKLKSSFENLNYFAQADNIYIMDNHLAAIWCWEKIRKDRNITLIHIDAHYDLGYSPTGEFMYKNIDLTTIPINDIVTIKHKDGYNYFMWDNYIHLFNDKYPNLINEFIAITQAIGDLSQPNGIKIEELNIWDLDSTCWYEYENSKILNIDIDYFFRQKQIDTYELFSDSLIDFFSNWLLINKNNFDLITIALSPECCGSWENSVNMANRILTSINLSIKV